MVGTLAKSSVLRKVWVVEIVCHVKLRLAPWGPRRYLAVSASSRLIQFGQFFEGLSPLVLSSRLMGVWMKCFRLSLAKLSAMKPFSVCFPCCLVGLEFCRFPMGGCAVLRVRQNPHKNKKRYPSCLCLVGPWGDPGPPALECCCLEATARVWGWGPRKEAKEHWSHSFREQGWAKQRTLAKPKYLTRFHFLLSAWILCLKVELWSCFFSYCSNNIVLLILCHWMDPKTI